MYGHRDHAHGWRVAFGQLHKVRLCFDLWASPAGARPQKKAKTALKTKQAAAGINGCFVSWGHPFLL